MFYVNQFAHYCQISLPQSFLKSFFTTFLLTGLLRASHSRNIFSNLFPLHFLLTGLLRASHSRNNFSSLFPLHFCLPDCCVLRTPAIISQVFSHYIFCLPDCYVLRTPAILSQVFSHYIFCLPDCYVLRTPAILPKHSHIVKLSLHFYAHSRACPKSSHPPLCKHRWMTGLVHCKQKKREATTLCFLS